MKYSEWALAAAMSAKENWVLRKHVKRQTGLL